jgi:hypothetical protein
VFLGAIVGHVPDAMVKAISSFLDFCYIARRNVFDEKVLNDFTTSLSDYHLHRKVFLQTGVRDDFNLPRQHSMVHYPFLVTEFGAPNGLDSSITESKHIKAVKQPYRRSSRFKALGQMLLTNQRLDKLAASRLDFQTRGMLRGELIGLHSILPTIPEDDPPPTNVRSAEVTENNDGCPVDTPHRVDNEVMLAKKQSKDCFNIIIHAHFLN